MKSAHFVWIRGLLMTCTMTGLATACAAALPEVDLNLPDGFVAEVVYKVPKSTEGSWVCLCLDDRGRLIASDQRGSLYRLTMADDPGSDPKVEIIDATLGMANGLLYAQDSLYAVVNGSAGEGPGLYRLRDTTGDDQFDSVQLLRSIELGKRAGADHGPHAVLLGPDKQSLYIVCGNYCRQPAGGFDDSLVPQRWDEDQLLPRMPDARGHAAQVMAPGGWIARTDLDGQQWTLVANGFRNVYDAAFDRSGELFTFDADMEWDIGTPWYRPTRVCHVVSGAEFGWRNGTGKWPTFYPDSLPPVVNIGLGSPTGVVFGFETNFPAPFRDALFICDWSYGRIYAVQLSPDGASFAGDYRVFASQGPLPVADLVVNPRDGAMYIVTGGRNVQSHIYRIRYEGTATDQPARVATQNGGQLTDSARLRQRLEEFHRPVGQQAVDVAWPYLKHADRYVRFAARIAVEHQPLRLWQERALQPGDATQVITAAVALARHANPAVRRQLLAALDQLHWDQLDRRQQLELLRAYGLVFIRLGSPTPPEARRLSDKLLQLYPADDLDLDQELSRMLCYLGTPAAIPPTLDLLESADHQEAQIHYALALRNVRNGWTLDLRRRYFQWFQQAQSLTGGLSVTGFVSNIRRDAEMTLSAAERAKLGDVLAALSTRRSSAVQELPQRPLVKQWKVDDLVSSETNDWSSFLTSTRDFRKGREMFAAASCIRCHRFAGHGGLVGPDLTGAGRRFGPRDLLETIIEPSKTIPHDYQAVIIQTVDGRVIVGDIVNLGNNGMSVRRNPLDPADLVRIASEDVETISPSKTSMMPAGLLDSLTREQILDLLAFMVSGGDAEHAVFAGD